MARERGKSLLFSVGVLKNAAVFRLTGYRFHRLRKLFATLHLNAKTADK
jgi:hypothetical protein